MKIKLLLKQNVDFQIILVALFFYASACLGYFLTFANTTELPAWPPSGIAFALIILLGRKAWPGITIGSLIANLMAYWNNPAPGIQAIMIVSCSIAIANTLETLMGNILVKKWIRDDFPFRNTKNTFRFLFVALVMCLTGALITTASLLATNIIQPAEVLRTGISTWIGSVVGILLFTPFILSIANQAVIRISSDKFFEIGICIVLSISVIVLLRVDYFHSTLERALPFLALPFLLWLAFRFDLLVAISAVLAVSLLSLYFTIHNEGPFVLHEPYYSMLLLQIFIGVMSISTLVLSATVTEREVTQIKLLEFNETLETKIQERTQALHDEISIRKEAEKKLQQTNEELSKRNTELDNFVYSVSHDLRAPIASVLGLINLAKKDDDKAMKNVYLELMQKSAQQQDHFIKEILDQSRNSRLDLKREEIYFESMIDETFNQLRYATVNGQNVEKVVAVKQNGPFYCDRWRMKVILNNIISNSIRYRNGRDPVIKVDVVVNERSVRMEIEDNGKGIDQEHLSHVFRMFYRATDDGAGSGLGLYIVKEAIDKLKGSIHIDSEVGKGTKVMLEIPEILN
jgi:signal transduction histidine kinase